MKEQSIQVADESEMFGPGTKVKIKDLIRGVNAGLDHMNIARAKGQGSGWGWGRGRKRAKFMVGNSIEACASVAVKPTSGIILHAGEELWVGL